MNKPLAGKIAIVTDGHYGIGALSAQTLADQGADVIISHPAHAWNAAGIVTGLEARGVNARAYAINCDRVSGIKTLISRVIADFGQVDILVTNNVSFVLVDDERIYSAAAIEAIAPVIREGGRIIAIGKTSLPHASANIPAHNNNHAPLHDLITHSAKSLHDRHVTVNRLQSNILGRKSHSAPSGDISVLGDIANGLSFLAGPESDFVTGTTFNFNDLHAA
ncbi:SDR family NAD(P)-dependent oxidoreductase [Thalassospira mesophila]|uniref:SDR family NAD(P)-dependent oxidoreductase n=1 Tax=Thalassospira mesophila TaxID=1293891 RepID=UPI000A1D5E29|nr:SDR family NAD(P)-dependent oxidoreductase [Thalassospira mesophila]